MCFTATFFATLNKIQYIYLPNLSNIRNGNLIDIFYNILYYTISKSNTKGVMHMKKTFLAVLSTSILSSFLLTGCSFPFIKPDEPQIIVQGPTTTETTSNDFDYKNDNPIPNIDDTPTTVNTDNYTIVPTETATIELQNYSTEDGYFTFKVPSNWKVETYPGDILSYTIKMYDPATPSRYLYFCATSASYKSVDALNIAQQYNYTGVDMSKTPINPGCSVESLFTNSAHAFDYSNFNLVENLGANGWGGDVLQATCTYQGEDCEGIFTGSSTSIGTSYYFDVDIMPVLEEATTIMMAPEIEFPSWQPIFTEIFGSITMSDSYLQARAQAWASIMQTSAELSRIANYTSDLIMSGWEARNNTYDIMSQQYSDATLGRDRVYDTETGEVYYTDLGWYDNYDGNRYKYVEPGSSYYNLPVSGTIQ